MPGASIPSEQSGTDEVMFLTEGDIDSGGLRDVIVATKPQHLAIYRRLDTNGAFAAPTRVPFPQNTGTAKGVAVGDIDGDGRPDLLFSCEHATGEKRGVMALLGGGPGKNPFAEARDISGPDGTKFRPGAACGSGRRWRPGRVDL
ncbi:MAG: VCBS repeat-containing protein [Bryobacterales bacterium]|nr:VCBS repeat-containing protein [Bryobacterales bacterium]